MNESDEKTGKKPRWKMTRRGFLIGMGTGGALAGAAWLFGVPWMRLKIAETMDSGGSFGGVEAEPSIWFALSADNRLTFYAPKIEMGQGVHTAFKQLAAEELEIAWEQMDVTHSTTWRGPQDSGGTSGSFSVSTLHKTIREAAAMMRELLRQKAAEKLGVEPNTLTITDGVFYTADGRQLTYAQSAEGVTEWPEIEPPALKPREQWRYIGKPMPRVDFPAKLRGEAIYGLDATLPNMLYGAVARPYAIEGKITSVEEGEARQVAGVVDVLIEGNFGGVVATNPYSADLGRNRLAITEEKGTLWEQAEIEKLVSVGNGTATIIQKEGETSKQFANSNNLTLEYRTPMAAHAHLEPQSALVDVQADKVTVYVSTQFVSMVTDAVAEALGRDKAEIEVIPTYVGGGFGRKVGTDQAVEAARLSKKFGRPVHVSYNRREEFLNGYLRPPTHHIVKGGLDANGALIALEHQQASGDVAFGFVPGFMSTVMGADFGATRGARIPYNNIEHRRTVAWRTEMPLATGWWRGLGLLANTFALESAIDELAHQAGRDPLEFRLALLGEDERNQRLKVVLTQAAERAGWGQALPAGRARGLALCMDAGTAVAQVVEVSADANNRLRVERVTCAIDPGLVINPDGVKAQTEGAIIMGLSSTLLEKLTVKEGRIAATNFNNYPLITMKESPAIEVILVESGDEPKGIGEPPIGPIAAATANAWFALTGQRLRDLPLGV